ncbi:SOS response-associated peptidase [Thermicanus aegyptius]|uniref:SOS response-associated peptidase n=1 Tax=Thermicanus aegyptius TaxID=94009 RepID=UPI00041796B3|nr:SOS response-associated peptidase [Thermicanus aegyptius]
MCGRFTLYTEFLKLIERFEVEFFLGEISQSYAPRYNIAPTQRILAVTEEGGKRILRTFRWGLIPFWAKEASMGNSFINARIESVLTKNSFKQSFVKRRCLILADGFYEWKREGRRKIPYYFFLPSREPFAMAGLWDRWQAPSGEEIFSCTIITREAAEEIRPIHDRMPLILPKGEEETWLDPASHALTPSQLQARFASLRTLPLQAHPVSTLVNSPQNESPQCIIPSDSQGSLF